jgi:hypothetical protein
MGSLENIKIVCAGFEVTAEAKENTIIVFKKLLDEAPYDAFLEINLEKVASGISGRIHISSLGGEFKAATVDMTPQDVVDTLSASIRNQIIEWKTTRFTDTPTAALA